MLVLSRRENEVLRIGDDIRISILSISRYQVRIGISAPRDQKIHREEVYLRIKRELEADPGNTNDE